MSFTPTIPSVGVAATAWWHVFAGEQRDGSTAQALIGPTALGPDDVTLHTRTPVRQSRMPLGSGRYAPWLQAWDHEPTPAEIDTAIDTAPPPAPRRLRAL